jgi:adenine deaminase
MITPNNVSSGSFSLRGQVVDVVRGKITGGVVRIADGRIADVTPMTIPTGPYILPGFVDAHVHIESSLLTPGQFARLAVVHGTVATVSDPHEIGNVLGVEGVRYMLENGRGVPFKFYFGAPSCVPATPFETAGAEISVRDVESLLQMPEIRYLAEMMNWPGVLGGDVGVLEKIALAKRYHKPVDGHAPGLRGQQAQQYAAAGITTDHECFTREEALDKLRLGMHVLIREGSAAKNFEALVPLLKDYPDQIMFCSDDKHPDSLVLGHIDQLVRRAVGKGIDVFKVLRAACVNPVRHYGLDVGLLQPGDPADLVVVQDLKLFKVMQTYINGQRVAETGRSLIVPGPSEIVNRFNASPQAPAAFALPAGRAEIPVIEAIDGQLVTRKLMVPAKVADGLVVADVENDILKITVVNRYQEAPPAVAFVKNFGLKEGAIASSVAHDSHNLIAVGTDDESISRAINRLIEARGGLAAVAGSEEKILSLPIAGLMSGEDGYEVARRYEALDKMAKKMGSRLKSPFMTLSFMALLVIPSLKLSDKGLFDGDAFAFVE